MQMNHKFHAIPTILTITCNRQAPNSSYNGSVWVAKCSLISSMLPPLEVYLFLIWLISIHCPPMSCSWMKKCGNPLKILQLDHGYLVMHNFHLFRPHTRALEINFGVIEPLCLSSVIVVYESLSAFLHYLWD